MKLDEYYCNKPRQDTVVQLPFPVTVIGIGIGASILNASELPIKVRARPVRVQRLKRTVEHPLPVNNATFIPIKLESVINLGVNWIIFCGCLIL